MNITRRKEAIKVAYQLSQPGDVVLIAGKGHENYQEVKGEKLPFDDYKIAQEIFSKNALAHVVLFIRIFRAKVSISRSDLFQFLSFLGLCGHYPFLCLYIDLREDHYPISKPNRLENL